MKKRELLNPPKLAELSLALREVREIDDYCRHVNGLFESIFDVTGGFSFCYHFYDGHLHTGGLPADLAEGWADLAGRVKFYHTDVWLEMVKSGQNFSHSALYAEQFSDLPKDLEEIFAFTKDRGEFMLGTWAFEGDFLLASAGVARPLSAGDFSETDILNFKALVPFWQKGMLESARYTRAKRLGGDFTALIENHPNAMFLFDRDDRLVYANYEAKLLLQNEPRASSGAAYAKASAIPPALVKHKQAGRAPLPVGKTALIRQLPDWPELGLQSPWLAIVPQRPVKLPLSPREVEALRAFARTDGATTGAKKLGAAPQTFRTHLKNISRKLGVSGSNAALTIWYLSGQPLQ